MHTECDFRDHSKEEILVNKKAAPLAEAALKIKYYLLI